jgi:hypothetical protein
LVNHFWISQNLFCFGRSVQANIEYLYIRSYGQTASVTSNLRVYSRT